MTVAPFSRPTGAMDPAALAIQVRGNDNVLQTALNALPFQAATVTSGVTTGATTIVAAITTNGAAFVGGDDGAGNAFVDVVVYHGAGTAVAVSSATTQGAPAARTYSVSGGALRLATGAGTYTVTAVSTAL